MPGGNVATPKELAARAREVETGMAMEILEVAHKAKELVDRFEVAAHLRQPKGEPVHKSYITVADRIFREGHTHIDTSKAMSG